MCVVTLVPDSHFAVVVLQLLIKGIRSFSPDNKTAIEFYKPLTLIVGQNGAGKTVGGVHCGFSGTGSRVVPVENVYKQ